MASGYCVTFAVSLELLSMHGRPRPKKGLPVDPEKEHARKQKACSRAARITMRIPPPLSWCQQSASFPLCPSQAQLYGKLAGEVLARRRQRRYDPESLELSARLLSLNPEVYTVWNYRCATAFSLSWWGIPTAQRVTVKPDSCDCVPQRVRIALEYLPVFSILLKSGMDALTAICL